MRMGRKKSPRRAVSARPNSGRFIEADGNVAFLIIVKLKITIFAPRSSGCAAKWRSRAASDEPSLSGDNPVHNLWKTAKIMTHLAN